MKKKNNKVNAESTAIVNAANEVPAETAVVAPAEAVAPVDEVKAPDAASILSIVEDSSIPVTADMELRVAQSLNLCTVYVRKDNVTHVLFTGTPEATQNYLDTKVAETGATVTKMEYPVVGKRRTLAQAVEAMKVDGFFKVRKDLLDRALELANLQAAECTLIPHGPFVLVEQNLVSSPA